MEKVKRSFSPFITRIDAPKKSDFDKYYEDVSIKEVYRKAGVDSNGEEYGVIERKLIVKKIDISELVNSQADTVGVEAYMRALSSQGDDISSFNTEVNKDEVVDYSQFPDSLAEVMMTGERAKEAFSKMDPALKGSHTTIEGFLGSLNKETIDAYIKGKVDAYLPKKEAAKEGE